MDDLVEMGSVTTAAAMFLRACVIDRHNILVSGGTGTGKTTMLNVLSSFIPFKERIITIEDTTELRLHQEHVVTLETKPANVEGAGEYTIRDLVKNALRMRPDRVIVGECRGPEALDMIQAMNTGHDGSMTTVHANSAREVVERLEVLVLMAADLPVASIHRQVGVGLGPDRSHQPAAGRGAGGHADLRGRPLRSGGKADRRDRHFQPPRRLAAADGLFALVCRFAGGEGLVGLGIPLRPRRREAGGDRAMNEPWQMWLGSLMAGAATAVLAYAGRDWFAAAMAAVECDLADKLRRMRAPDAKPPQIPGPLADCRRLSRWSASGSPWTARSWGR